MATVVREIMKSRESSEMDGRRTAKRIFVVYDDATPANLDTPDEIVALFGTATTPDAMPAQGDSFSGTLTTIKASDYEIQHVQDDSPYIWHVTWYYEATGGAVIGPNEESFTELNFAVSREFSPAWRMAGVNGWGYLPTQGIPAPSATGPRDIGGVPIDSGGEPGTMLRLKQILEYSEVMTATNVANLITTLIAAVGRRNSVAFKGAAIGKVLMLPVSTQRVEINLYAVRFGFAYDELYHMEQQAARDQGIVIENQSGIYKGAARIVSWIQPFPDFYDFTGISSNW